MTSMENRIEKALRGKKKKPLLPRELMKMVSVKKGEKTAFQDALLSLKAANRVIEKKGKLVLTESLGLVNGEVVKITATFGFVRPEGRDTDVFVPGRALMGAMPGDQVLLRVTHGHGDLPEGEVYKVVEYGRNTFSAVLENDEYGPRVRPDHVPRMVLQVNPRALMKAKDGDKVLCEISVRGQRHSEHVARIVQVFGSSDNAAACCEAILAANGIRREFPPEVEEQARTVAESGIHPKELEARMDLRDQPIFTIDGADTKDIDDAISLRKTQEGWELGVHIADVSHYVTQGSPLDREAYQRGTSVYFADSVVPMLPKELSNGICSLNPEEDRLAFSALLQLDANGMLVSSSFAKTVIRSCVKGVYSEVNQILDDTASPALLGKYEELIPTLKEMRDLAAVLTKNRYARGSVNLETVESKLILGPDGKVEEVKARQRGVSETVIEEFMLIANEAAAALARTKGLPFVYRVHDKPAPDKIVQLTEAVSALGLTPPKVKKSGEITPDQLSALLKQAKDTPKERVVSVMTLRSMAKARYSEQGSGHFGLALKDYAHFTSPIRRYPDLAIHRVLSAYVAGVRSERIVQKFGRFAADSAGRSSEREVAAMTAERDCEDCYKAEYMKERLGEEFDGVVTSVTGFGIYVALENTVEGLVHLTRLPEGQWAADDALAMVERHTGKRISLGDPVRVRVAGADVSAGTIDFDLLSFGA